MTSLKKNRVLWSLPLTVIVLLSLVVNSSFPVSGSIYVQTTYQLVVFLIACLLFLLCIRQRKIEVNHFDILIMTFVAYQLIRDAIEIGNLSYESKFYENICLFSIYGLTRLLFPLTGAGVISNTLTGIVLLLAAYGYGQWFGILPRSNAFFTATGTYSNPAAFAGFLALGAPLTLASFGKTTGNKIMMLRVAMFCFVIGAIVISQSRAALLSVVVASTLLFFVRPAFFALSSKLKAVYFVSMTVVLLALLGILYKARPESADGRLMIWKITQPMIHENLLFGGGTGYFEGNYNAYQGKYLSTPEASDREKFLSGEVQTAFNEYLNTLVNGGIIRLILLLMIIYMTWRSYAAALLTDKAVHYPVALLSISVFAFFSYPLHVLSISTVMFVSFGVMGSQMKERVGTRAFLVDRRLLQLYAAGLLFFITSVGLHLKSLGKWKSALEYADYNPAESLRLYDEAKVNLQNNIPFLYNYAAELADLGYYKKSLQIFHELEQKHTDIKVCSQIGRCYESSSQYPLAEKYFKMAANMQPYLLNAKLLLFNLYVKANQPEDTKRIAKLIIATPVKVKTREAEKIKENMRLYLLENAL